MVCESLQKRFPKTEFTFTNAGVASTCSTTGAFRLKDQVLNIGPVDLIFVEFAVNDDQDAHHTRIECIRGMEGIVRQILRHNPYADIVVTYFVNDHMLSLLSKNQPVLSSSSHEEVMEHYTIPVIALNSEISQRIQSGRLTWKQYGGTHPGPTGNRICANMIERLLEKNWGTPIAENGNKVMHVLSEIMDKNSYDNGHFVSSDRPQIVKGWKLEIPDWTHLSGEIRPSFKKESLFCATEPGAELTLPFEGRAVGIYLLAGPDAGILETSIDGAPAQSIDLFDSHSPKLHYPKSILFNADLQPGPHLLKIIISAQHNKDSTGTAARILKFCEN